MCTFVKLNHAEAWKTSYQKFSGFSQKLKMTPLTEYFRPGVTNVVPTGTRLPVGLS